MKNLLFLLFPVLLLSCITRFELTDEYPLRRITSSEKTSVYGSGGFFLFMGGFDYRETTEIKVKFSWLTPKGFYAISEVPIDKIRIQIVDSLETPKIRFKNLFIQDECSTPEQLEEKLYNRLDTYIDWHVDYVIVYCKEEHYPININLNNL